MRVAGSSSLSAHLGALNIIWIVDASAVWLATSPPALPPMPSATSMM